MKPTFKTTTETTPLKLHTKLFTVVYDDEGGLICPMQWDEDCEGAITAWYEGKIATFFNRKEARIAINISTKFAALQKAQGKVVNEDFIEFRKRIKVVELSLPK